MYENLDKRIQKLNLCMINMNNDMKEMIKISETINLWIERGINIDISVKPLDEQIEEWNHNMHKFLNDFSNNIHELKTLDNRINEDPTTILNNELQNTYSEKWEYYYSVYNHIFENLYSDIDIIKSCMNDLKKYNECGISTGNAMEVLQEQMDNINEGISNSLNKLDILCQSIEEESKRIITLEELNQKKFDEEEKSKINKTENILLMSKHKKPVSLDISTSTEAKILNDAHSLSFNIVPALSGDAGAISFQSVQEPDKYLRHAGFVMWLHNNNNSELFYKDSSFYIKENLYFDGYTAYESVNYRNYYISLQGDRLKIIPNNNSNEYKTNTSFRTE